MVGNRGRVEWCKDKTFGSNRGRLVSLHTIDTLDFIRWKIKLNVNDVKLETQLSIEERCEVKYPAKKLPPSTLDVGVENELSSFLGQER